jgi:hypothetical protein
MRIAAAGSVLLTVGLCITRVAGAQDFGKLKFMAGCWQGLLGPDKVVEEIWTAPAENLMLATTRTLEKKRATSWEFTALERAEGTVFYISTPNGEVPDTFRLKFLVDEAATWERAGTEFPNRIMYRLASDGSLIVRLESEDASQAGFELRMRRLKCPGT